MGYSWFYVIFYHIFIIISIVAWKTIKKLRQKTTMHCRFCRSVCFQRFSAFLHFFRHFSTHFFRRWEAWIIHFSKRRKNSPWFDKNQGLWCRWWDSNPHGGLAQRILSPSRLPFHHTGFWKTPQTNLRRLWSWMRDSNSRPHDYESGALPAELIQHSLRKLSYITTREHFRQLFSFSLNPDADTRAERGE